MSITSSGMNRFFMRHNMIVKETKFERATLWLAGLTHEEQDALADMLEERYEQYKLEAANSNGKYTIFETIFPMKKEHDWPIKRMIAEIKDDAQRKAEFAELEASKINDLGRTCRTLEKQMKRLRDQPGGDEDEYFRAERDFTKARSTYRIKTMQAIENGDLQAMADAARWSIVEPEEIWTQVVGDNAAIQLLAAIYKKDGELLRRVFINAMRKAGKYKWEEYPPSWYAPELSEGDKRVAEILAKSKAADVTVAPVTNDLDFLEDKPENKKYMSVDDIFGK